MTRSDDWTWEFRPPAARAFEGLDSAIQQRLVSKLDGIVTDAWRDSPAYIEPLSGAPHDKIRIGDFLSEWYVPSELSNLPTWYRKFTLTLLAFPSAVKSTVRCPFSSRITSSSMVGPILSARRLTESLTTLLAVVRLADILLNTPIPLQLPHRQRVIQIQQEICDVV